MVLKQILSEFLTFNGVTTAALVSRDGFVIDMTANATLDSDAIGALGSSSINLFEKGGAAMECGKLRQMMLEYQNGAIILTPVSKEEFLIILTDTTNNLSHMASLIASTRRRVAAAM